MAKTVSQALEAMQLVMGPLPKSPDTPPKITEYLSPPVDVGFATRTKLAYEPEPGDEVPAYLFIPYKPTGQAALCLHQTMRMGKGHPAGLDGSPPNLRYALELAERGFVTFAPDYPNFGDYSFDPYANGYVSATMKGILNHKRGVDLLRALPQVDPEKIAAIGHSLGGHNSIFVAAFDPRIRAVVSSCGFTSLHKYYKGDLTGWSHKGYMPRVASVYDKSPDKMPFEFWDILAAVAPRPIFVNAPLRDANFEPSGVDDCAAQVSNLIVRHPDCEHDFPQEVRFESYEFLARRL
jgi:dienelactone hydrolase